MDVNTTNATILDKPPEFSKEYMIFNYTMVGISCGLLLFVIIIAKLLCIFNRNSDYDDLSSIDNLPHEKGMFGIDEMENVHNEESSSSSNRHLPRSAHDSSESSRIRAVWHTPQTLPDVNEDFFIGGYDTFRKSKV
ncbi:hypothetical protein CHUAL_008601 [Chamberlinius hualienensis]